MPWLAALFLTIHAGAQTPEVLRVELGGGQTLEAVRIEPGSFQQGSPPQEAGRGADETMRKVTLTRPFFLGKYPVTRGQFARFVAESGYRTEAETGTSGGFGWDGTQLRQRRDFTWKSPGFAQTDAHPVTLVTYKDAGAFLQWLSRKSGRTFTLPSEAQWEYAARSGGAAATEAWHKENSGGATHPVGEKPVNAWGLGDLLGNVWEWCEDWYAPYTAADATDPLQRDANLSDKPRRVLRGGSWLREPKFCRPAARYRNDALSRNADNGFRVMTFDLAARPAVVAPPPPVHLEAEKPAAAAPISMSEKLRRDLPVPIPTREDSSLAPVQKILPLAFFGGIALMLVGIVVSLLRRAGAKAGGIVNAPPLPSRSSGQPLSVRVADDGFWIMGAGVSAGTQIACRYLVDGNAMTKAVSYEPGPQGQFVFTGSRPSNVSVSTSTGGSSGSMTSRRLGGGIGMASALDDDPPFRSHPPAY